MRKLSFLTLRDVPLERGGGCDNGEEDNCADNEDDDHDEDDAVDALDDDEVGISIVKIRRFEDWTCGLAIGTRTSLLFTLE